MEFEGFEKYWPALSPIISIVHKGFGFNTAAAAAFNLTEAKWVDLYFHEEKYQVLFRPLRCKSKGAVALHRSPNGKQFHIESRTFFRRFQLNQEEFEGRYAAQQTEDGILISLQDPVGPLVGGRPRAR